MRRRCPLPGVIHVKNGAGLIRYPQPLGASAPSRAGGMRRRDVIAGLRAAVACWPLAVRAQPATGKAVGVPTQVIE